MLSKPIHGWTDVTIGTFTDRASYINDIPVICLREMIHTYQNPSLPFCVQFDAEGWEYTVVSNWSETHVFTNKNDPEELFLIDVSCGQLAKELIKDIESELDGWVWWDCLSPEEYEVKFEEITGLIADLKSQMKRREELYSGRRSV